MCRKRIERYRYVGDCYIVKLEMRLSSVPMWHHLDPRPYRTFSPKMSHFNADFLTFKPLSFGQFLAYLKCEIEQRRHLSIFSKMPSCSYYRALWASIIIFCSCSFSVTSWRTLCSLLSASDFNFYKVASF